MADPVREALRSILMALATDFDGGTKLGATLSKKKDLKEALAPIAGGFKYGMHPDVIAQIALELPVDAPLHVAAASLLAEGVIARAPWVSIAPPGQPKRSVQDLLVDRSAPIVYAIEPDLRIAAWSLETGVHLADYVLPNDKKMQRAYGMPGEIHSLVQRDDGTLRVLTSQGHVADLAPGARAFAKVMEIGTLRFGFAASPMLDLFVTQNQFDPIERDGAKVQAMRVHDASARTSRDVIVPVDHPDGVWAWDGDAAWFGALKIIRTGEGPNDWHYENALVRVDARTNEVSCFAAPGRITSSRTVRPGVLLVQLSVYDAASAQSDDAMNEIDLETQTYTKVPMTQPSPTAHFIRAPDGRAYDPQNRRFVDASGAVIGHYAIASGPSYTQGFFDAPRDRFVLVGGHPGMPVLVLAPFSAERAAAMPAPVATRALAWARPGVVLTYDIADFDAADTYRFEVLAVEGALALRITMNEEEPEVVAERAVFSDAALESAKQQVALAQGGADVDLEKEQSAALPPILVPRTTQKKLASGKSAPWKSVWSEATSIETGAKGPMSIATSGGEIAVAVIRASGDGADVVVLDDARWPLVIERVEGDCHVRLTSIDLSRASSETVTAPLASSAPSGARRFELVEGTSAKFWEVSVTGNELTTRFGKIGTSGQSSTKDLGSPDAAAKEEAKLVREKTKKGYAEK